MIPSLQRAETRPLNLWHRLLRVPFYSSPWIWTGALHNTTVPVLLGCSCGCGPRGSTSRELPNHTRGAKLCWREAVILSRLHLWGLACLSEGPVEPNKGALGGFGWEWEATLLLDAVNASLNGSMIFGTEPGGAGMEQMLELQSSSSCADGLAHIMTADYCFHSSSALGILPLVIYN